MEQSISVKLIKLFDEYLISTGKSYISLRSANELLKNQNDLELVEVDLKKILSENKIPHAYQTEEKPRQWHIPYSNLSEFKEYRKEYLKRNKSQISKENVKPKSNVLAFILIGIAVIIAFNIFKPKKKSYESKTIENTTGTNESQLLHESTSENENSSNSDLEPNDRNEINLNDFTGQKFTFKSNSNDNELNGAVIKTNNEPSYHEFDFINMTVTCKFPVENKWVTMTYPINGYYKQSGLLGTTHVLQVGTLGLKEIWFSADVPNLGYDFDDGHRIACYELTQVK